MNSALYYSPDADDYESMDAYPQEDSAMLYEEEEADSYYPETIYEEYEDDYDDEVEDMPYWPDDFYSREDDEALYDDEEWGDEPSEYRRYRRFRRRRPLLSQRRRRRLIRPGWREEEGMEFDDWQGEDNEDYDDTAELAESLREVLHEDYAEAAPEQMQETLEQILSSMTPAEGFSFKKALRSIKRAGKKVLRNRLIGKIARKALPIVGGAVGTLLGPAGTALGAKLGQVASKAFKAGGKKAGIGGVVGSVLGAVSPGLKGIAAGGSPAALQLLQMTQNKDMLKGLMALASGAQGRSTLRVGKKGPRVPLGSLMNVWRTLAAKAAEEADMLSRDHTGNHGYMLDEEGEFVVDPAVPEDRAMVLYDALMESEAEEWMDESVSIQPWQAFLPFREGQRLKVKYQIWGPDITIGRARVRELTPTLVDLTIIIDSSRLLNIDQTKILLRIQYRQEGAGNTARVLVNGQRFEDNNVTMRTIGQSRQLILALRLMGESINQVLMTRTSDDEAELKFTARGKEHTLVLSQG